MSEHIMSELRMTDADLDALLAAPLPEAPASRLAERVTARALDARLKAQRLRFLLSAALLVAIVAILPWTTFGSALAEALVKTDVAAPLAVATASIIFSFFTVRIMRGWPR